MSQLEVNKIIPQSGTTLTIGDSGDTISFASGVLPSLESLTITGDLTVDTNTLFVDSTNNRVGVGTASPTSPLTVSTSSGAVGLKVISTSAGTLGPDLSLQHDSASPADNDIISLISFQGNDSGGTNTTYSQVRCIADDITDTTEDGSLAFLTTSAGSLGERMRITSSGSVGIGTSSPARTIELSNSNPGVRLTDTDGPYVGEITQSGLSTFLQTQTSGGNIVFRTDTASEAMRIDSSGNVGIGTSSPSSLLHLQSIGPAILTLEADTDNVTETDNARIELLQDSGIVVGRIGYQSGTNSLEFWNEYTEDLRFGTSNSERMRIDSSGYVGIGTSSPTTQLDVRGSTFSLVRVVTGDTTSQAGIDFGDTTDNDIGRIRYDNSNNSMIFRTNAADRMSIDSSGRVGIATTSTLTEILQVNGNIRLAGNGRQIFFGNPPGSGSGGGPYGFRFDDDSTTSYDLYFRTSPNEISWEVNGTDKVQIQSDGDIFNTNGTYGTISDQKLKQQITDASSQWEDIKNIRVRKYKLNQQVEELGDSDDLWRLGVVAQELELTSPALIHTKTDYSKETGEDLGTTTKTVKMSILYMKAVKALQEAMTRIESLETENTSIKARLETLENA